MFKSSIKQFSGVSREFTRNVAMKNDVHLSSRRVMKKIKLGKARPTIFHQFETLVELSDGSVIKRTSQAPKDEIRMINDQRNSLLWNPNRSDINTSDPNATGKVNKFKQRFSAFESEPSESTPETQSPNTPNENDHFIELMGHNVKEVTGGSLYNKKAKGKKGKK